MFECSLGERKPSLASSCFYASIVDLLGYLQRAVSADSETQDAGRFTAARSLHDKLTCEISRLVMGKLETGDKLVVSRLEKFVVCIADKSRVPADTQGTDKLVRFVECSSDDLASSPSSALVAADEEASCSVSMQGADVLGDGEGPLWSLVCDSCSLSYRFVCSESSPRHLRFLAAVLSRGATDGLLTNLLAQAQFSSADDRVSSLRQFLEQMLLPLVDKFGDDEGSCHLPSLVMLIYGRLQPHEQVLVVKRISDRAGCNVICADVLSEIIRAQAPSEDVQLWLCGDDFGEFIVSLTEDLCHRQRSTPTNLESVVDRSMVNERSMDDSHWKLLCACLAVNQQSGSLCLTCYIMFMYFIINELGLIASSSCV